MILRIIHNISIGAYGPVLCPRCSLYHIVLCFSDALEKQNLAIGFHYAHVHAGIISNVPFRRLHCESTTDSWFCYFYLERESVAFVSFYQTRRFQSTEVIRNVFPLLITVSFQLNLLSLLFFFPRYKSLSFLPAPINGSLRGNVRMSSRSHSAWLGSWILDVS